VFYVILRDTSVTEINSIIQWWSTSCVRDLTTYQTSWRQLLFVMWLYRATHKHRTFWLPPWT